ncbi:hypothetical protein X798_05682 [Onchocerca flexuosa]|uniref:LITAF domain-containing protein n=1 Tax=Onchocerca flexuosa TaxID=387005 RepID=A0A238BR17_9BILA|nr:hypothetical protein X798_05682 [Onchocerca flexuosa]
MNNFEGNHQKGPPSYEAAVGSSTNADGISQSTGKFGPFPPSPQPSTNPAYMPQTVNPTLPNPSAMYPEPQTIPVIVGVPIFGSHSCTMTCPSCNKAIVTETRTHAGLLAFIICGILLLFGMWITPAQTARYCWDPTKKSEKTGIASESNLTGGHGAEIL